MNLALVFHNHQPIGQLAPAFELVWGECYAPFLEALEAHPRVRASLHYTGPLLDWLREEHPETLAQVRRLVERGQVEILTGACYEPILAVWPPDDARAQIELLTRQVRELFGVQARGLWLAERVWEPALSRLLASCDIDYSFVDHNLLKAANVNANEIDGVFRTHDDALWVFPIDAQLRELIPWREPHQAIEYLREVEARRGADALVTFADDGEKFGAWPGTHHYIFEQGWLERFFTSLEENAAWLQTVMPQQCAAKYFVADARRVQLPSGSYAEMLEWSGGNWRHFLERYDESRDLFQTVQRVAERVRQLCADIDSSDNAKLAMLDEARDHVLRAQCNDAYWHGVFGGLYLRHLRQAIYAHAAHAQVLCDKVLCVPAPIETQSTGEVIARTARQEIGWRARGGHIFHWTSKASRHNLLATLRRRRENYHGDAAIVDWHPRGACLEHFFGPDTTAESFAQSRFDERGDFVSENWSLETQSDEAAIRLMARRAGGIWTQSTLEAAQSVFAPLEIIKTLTLHTQINDGADVTDVEYKFRNGGDVEISAWWASEWNLALSGFDWPQRHFHADDHTARERLEAIGCWERVRNPIVADWWLQLWFEWQWDEPLAMWHVPIVTTSQKEGGALEETYQQSAFVFHRQLILAPGEERRVTGKVLCTAKRAL